MSRLERVLLAGVWILGAGGAYLAAAGDPRPFYFVNVLLHLLLGLGLLVPFGLWWWRRRGAGLLAANLLLSASALTGLVLAWAGNLSTLRALLWAHVALGAAGLLGLLWAFRAARRGRLWRFSAAALAAAVALPLAALALQAARSDPRDRIVNPRAPASMAEEAQGGESGPFFPSSVSTATGETLSSSIYLDPESCGRGGCHGEIVRQWRSSAHHFSSFNNQWYRKSIEYMQEVAGVEPSKWCAGCHDPALLLSGMMDRPVAEVLDTPEAQAGLTCTACHLISAVESSMGQGDYEIRVPALHDLATSENPLLTRLHDLLVRLDPEPHRRTFLRPFFRGEDSAEYCSACHKVHLDVPVNGYRWIRGFNEYDNWQASGVSGEGARSFYYPPEPRNCIDCHMPRLPADDPAAKGGLIRSHRFAAANTALPVANRDDEQLAAVTAFLQANQVSVDIFAMTEARLAEEAGEGLRLEGPALATGFAVGEEQGMAVGSGAGPARPAEAIFAPLDRIPATVRRGESTRIDVVVRTRGVGHFFPGGTVDAYDCWLELKAVDDRGRVVFWSGKADEDSPVEAGAHFYRSLMIDAHGNPIDKRNAFANRAVVYVRLIPPGAADMVRFRLDVPEDAGDEIRLTARLNYRKFAWFNTQWAYAGVPDPDQQGATFAADHDDRRFVFTGDTAGVSGELKEIPRLPIVVMDEAETVLRVVDADAALPNMTIGGPSAEGEAGPGADRERWNDYGIGLLLQGDLRGAQRAFREVTRVEPGYVDGWVNRGRVALAEGDLDEARKVLARALEIEPELPRAHFFLGLLEKELGEYERALEHLSRAAARHPRDRVVRNQMGRVHFLMRDYEAARRELEEVLAIDPEDLMAHYTLMLANRGLGDLESSRHHQRLYERFKADEASQILTGDYRQRHPHDNNERQAIHEHHSVALDGSVAREGEGPPAPAAGSAS